VECLSPKDLNAGTIIFDHRLRLVDPLTACTCYWADNSSLGAWRSLGRMAATDGLPPLPAADRSGASDPKPTKRALRSGRRFVWKRPLSGSQRSPTSSCPSARASAGRHSGGRYTPCRGADQNGTPIEVGAPGLNGCEALDPPAERGPHAAQRNQQRQDDHSPLG